MSDQSTNGHSIDRGAVRKVGVPLGIVAMLGTSGYNVYQDRSAGAEARESARTAVAAVERVERTLDKMSDDMKDLVGGLAEDVKDLELAVATIQASRFSAQDGVKVWAAIADIQKAIAVSEARQPRLPLVP